jgi:hypothetical protein
MKKRIEGGKGGEFIRSLNSFYSDLGALASRVFVAKIC